MSFDLFLHRVITLHPQPPRNYKVRPSISKIERLIPQRIDKQCTR